LKLRLEITNRVKNQEPRIKIAIASSFELETELLLAVDLNYINEVQINSVMQVIQEVQKMIFGFKESLKIK
jgi:four helix bundle protein